ncbi:MAG: C2 family cysteine protease [Schaalia sp.]
MAAGFSQRFPAVTGDLGSIWSCQNEMRNRPRQIGELYTDVNTVIGRCDEWTGLARDAFVTSADAEKREIGIWEDGTLQAANALKSYYFTLEWVIGSVNGIRARADELWAQYQAMPPETRSSQHADIEGELAYLQTSYNDAKHILSEEALNTAAILREALYFTPEDIHKETSHGLEHTLDYGDTRPLSDSELSDIFSHLADPSPSLFNIDQGRIGDCHLLASLNAYNQTKEGRRYLASLITVHYDSNGMADGFFVTLPGYDGGHQRIFVQDVLVHGNGNDTQADIASIFEKAFVQSHMGGTRGKFPTWGASGSFSAWTMKDISGENATPTFKGGFDRDAMKEAAINGIQAKRPVVAESSILTNDTTVTTPDGSHEKIKIVSQHAYTVIGADENGVTLTNPWGHNNRSVGGNSRTGATFTMSWEDFYANFGDVTVGRIP